MYGCESWTIKKAEGKRIDAFELWLEKTLESPLDCNDIQPVHPKRDQSWEFTGRTDVEAETPILWPPHVKSWLIWKDPDAGKDWGQEEKGTKVDEMVGWHHRLNGHGFGWTPGVCDGQGGLVCCGSWGCKESDTTERLNWTESMSSSAITFLSWNSLSPRLRSNFWIHLSPKLVSYFSCSNFSIVRQSILKTELEEWSVSTTDLSLSNPIKRDKTLGLP